MGSGDPSGLQNRRELALLALVSSTLTRFRQSSNIFPAEILRLAVSRSGFRLAAWMLAKAPQVRLSHASAIFVFNGFQMKEPRLLPDGAAICQRRVPEWPYSGMSFSGNGAYFQRAFRLAGLLTFVFNIWRE